MPTLPNIPRVAAAAALVSILAAPAPTQPPREVVLPGEALEIPVPPARPMPAGGDGETDPEPFVGPPLGPPAADAPAAPAPPPEPAPPEPAPDPEPPPAPAVGSEPMLSLAERAAAVLGMNLAGPPPDPVAVAGGAADLAQSLAQAVFAAPVAGSIPYIVHAEVYHDVTLVLPDEWDVVSVFVGDPARWALYHVRHLVVLKPGEAGIRTNLTVVLSNGDLLQMDVQEVTGLPGRRRTGRVYIGPEPWLVDRIFGMLPAAVRESVARSPATIAELLADPVTVIGLYGGTGAVPHPLAAELASRPRGAGDLPAVPTLGSLDGVAPSGPPPGPAPPLPGEPSARLLPAAPAAGAAAAAGEARGAVGARGTLVSGQAVASLEAELDAALRRVESARAAAGDRVAAAQLGIEADVEALRTDYPLRTQFSYVLDPPAPPYTEPWWHFGIWHDGERTYARLLGIDPEFRDEASGRILEAELLGDYLYRLDRLVEDGVVFVVDPGSEGGSGRRGLRFRRRPDLEAP